MQAIFIDSTNKEIRMIEAASYDEMKKLMGVDLWTVAITDGDKNELQVMVDDEGLFKEGNLPAFTYQGYPGTLVGNGMIFQIDPDKDGDPVPITSTSLEDVKRKVGFTTMLNSSRNKILNTPPQVESFNSLDDMRKAMGWDNNKPVVGSSILTRYKRFMEENSPQRLTSLTHSHTPDPRLIFVDESLAGDRTSMIYGVVRPTGMGQERQSRVIVTPLFELPNPLVNANHNGDTLANHNIMQADADNRPFFLGEPFPSLWIECVSRPLLTLVEGKDRINIHAIYLWRSHDDVYLAILMGESNLIGKGMATIMSDDGNPGDADYRISAVHSFLFHLFQTLAKKGQLGTERLNERFRVGTGSERRQVKIKDVVHVRLRRKITTSTPTPAPSEPRNIEWSHRWEVMGHWRKVTGIGKDDRGKYHIQGYTWVVPHTKGPDEKEVVKKTRIIITGSGNEKPGSGESTTH